MLRFPSGRFLLAVPIIVILGCHSPALKPPGAISERGPEGDWLKAYKLAREEQRTNAAEAACPRFQALAADAKFPARDLARLRAWETCGAKMPGQLDRTQMPLYLNSLALDVSLKLAAAQNDRAAEMELASEKARDRMPQAEKVKWLKLALTRANELGQADKVKEFTKRLYQVAPRLNPEPTEKEFLAVAADYRLARQFTKAHDYFERVIRSKSSKLDDKITALKGLRLATKNARNFDEHLAACRRVTEFLNKASRANPKNQSLRLAAFDAHTFEARALWTQGRTGEARDLLNRLEKAGRARVSLAEVYWLKARMAEEEKDFARVSLLLDKALSERTPDRVLRDKILWYAAWNERRQSKFNGAAERFANVIDTSSDEFLRLRAMFWQGRSLIDAKKEDAAKPILEKLITLDPLGYYGLLAHRQLGQEISFKAAASEALAPPKDLPVDLKLAEWLGALEERDALTPLLDLATKAYRKQSAQTEEGWVTLFKYYAKAGLFVKLYDALGTLDPEQRKLVLESHPELLFPRPWSEEVRTAALQFGVQEELIYAIMRQESAFDPQARSLADAFGLLQILPEVAERLGGAHKIDYHQMDDLYDPRTNIQLGAAHLKDLLHGHKDQFILAVAAYNANEKAIRNWMKTRFRGDPLEFIEEIPFEETRVYVRLVMRNLIFYSLFNSRTAAIEFPAWLLKLDPT